MPAHATTKKRIPVKGIGWKKPLSIAAEKYEQVSKAILAVLTDDPVTFTRLTELVAKRLPGFDGSVSWYTIFVVRELEAQGKVVRQVKPVRYARPGRAAAAVPSARPDKAMTITPSRRAGRTA